MKTLVKFDILENIGMFNNYEHQVDFENVETQLQFWNERILKTFTNVKVNFVNDNIVKVVGNYQELKNTSYARAMVQITINNVTTTKYYYYFINNIRLLSTNEENPEQIVELTIEEDVMQTYMFDYQILESFVEREHQDRWKKENNALKPIFSITPENLDIGEEYIIKETKILPKWEVGSDFEKRNIDIGFVVVCCSSFLPELEDVSPNFDGLFYYAFPILPLYRSFDVQFDVNFDQLAKSSALFNYFRSGNGAPLVLGMYYTKTIGAPFVEISAVSFSEYSFMTEDENVGYATKFKENAPEGLANKYIISLESETMTDNFIKTNFQEFTDEIAPILPSISQDSSIVYESKLLTYPYNFTKITNHRVDGLLIKNEFLSDEFEMKVALAVSVTQKSAFWITNYKVLSTQFMRAVDNTICDLPLATSQWQEYLSQNKASATTGMALQTVTDVVGGVASGAIGSIIGGITGSTPNAIIGGVSGIVSTGNKIAQRYLKQKDIKESPPNLKFSGNNAAFDVQVDNINYYKQKYTIQDYYKNRIYKYFMHFGYMSNELKVPNIKSRYYYNYIKMDSDFMSKINNNILIRIRQIYENGITLWHYRNKDTFKFLDYSKENVEMSLIGA